MCTPNETNHPYRTPWQRAQTYVVGTQHWRERKFLAVLLGAFSTLATLCWIVVCNDRAMAAVRQEAAWADRDYQMSRISEHIMQETQLVYGRAFGNTIIMASPTDSYVREVNESPEWVTIIVVEDSITGGERTHSVSCTMPVRRTNSTQEVLWGARPICTLDQPASL